MCWGDLGCMLTALTWRYIIYIYRISYYGTRENSSILEFLLTLRSRSFLQSGLFPQSRFVFNPRSEFNPGFLKYFLNFFGARHQTLPLIRGSIQLPNRYITPIIPASRSLRKQIYLGKTKRMGVLPSLAPKSQSSKIQPISLHVCVWMKHRCVQYQHGHRAFFFDKEMTTAIH